MKKIFLSIFLFFLSSTLSKTISKHIHPIVFQNASFIHLGRFYCDEGTASLSIRRKNLFTRNVTNETLAFFSLVVIKSEDFDEFSNEKNCSKAKKFAVLEQNIPAVLTPDQDFETNNFLTQNSPQLYYFVLMDCEESWIETFEIYNELLSFLNIELTIRNTNDSHFSLEEQQLIFPCILSMILIAGFLFFNFSKMYNFYRKQEIIDYPLIITAIGLSFEFLSLILQLLNLLYYSNNGRNNYFFSFSQIFSEAVCNFALTLIFIFVAWGWTINYLDILNFDYFMPTIAVLGAANVSLVVLNNILYANDDRPKIGLNYLHYIYFLYKAGFFVYFLLGIFKTYGIARNKIRGFIIKFISLGILFFVSYGILLMISNTLHIYHQKKFILIGNEIINVFISLALLKIFDSKIYNELSFKGKNSLPQDNQDLPKLY